MSYLRAVPDLTAYRARDMIGSISTLNDAHIHVRVSNAKPHAVFVMPLERDMAQGIDGRELCGRAEVQLDDVTVRVQIWHA